MTFSTPDLLDDFSAECQVLEPMLRNFGGKTHFYGEIVTVKCHEDNSLVKQQVEQAGEDKVLVVFVASQK